MGSDSATFPSPDHSNLYGFVYNQTISLRDHLGLASVSDGAFEYDWDLNHRTEYELYPGGKKSKPPEESWGITLMKYKIEPKCCRSTAPNHFRLEEIHLTIYSKVHLYGKLLQFGSKLPDGRTVLPDMNIFAYANEIDHVNDYADYANSPKPLQSLERIENSLKRSNYLTEELCVEAAKAKVLNDNGLRAYSEEANIKTVKNWDSPRFSDGFGGKTPHEYPGGDWWNQPGYERYASQ